MGRCLLTAGAVTPGHVTKLLFRMACSQVDVTGLKQAACKYWSRSGLELVWWAWKPRLGADGLPRGRVGGDARKGSSHKLVAGSRGPSRRIFSWCRMRHLSCENWTTHPWSQNLAMDNRECDARPGRMWALVLAAGRVGKLKVQVWLDWIPAPFGMRTVIGYGSGLRSRCGLEGFR